MRKNFCTCLGILAAMAVMTGCGGGNKTDATETAPKDTTVLVKTAVAVTEDVEQTTEFTSNIKGAVENNIAPSAPGRIDKLLVDVGSVVRKGQILVNMDPTQYNTVAIQLANSELDFQRMQKVYDAGGLPKQQLDQVEAQINVLREQAANLRTNTNLKSPIDGIVTARNYDPGDMYSGLPILTVMQINLLKVELALSEQYFPMVKNGMRAEITVDMYPDKVYEGRISRIYPAIDPATRTFTVEIDIPNRNNELRPGMFSRTTLKFGSKPGLMIEDIAIQKQLGTSEKYVFIARDGKAVRRVVTTGTQIGDRVNILTGIEAGDEVIVAGISKLMDGTAITVKN